MLRLCTGVETPGVHQGMPRFSDLMRLPTRKDPELLKKAPVGSSVVVSEL